MFTYSAFGRKSKAILSWAVGKRTQETTNAFVADLRARILVVPLMTSDGLTLYVPAVASAFAGFVDYAQVVKQYGYNPTIAMNRRGTRTSSPRRRSSGRLTRSA